MTSFVLNHYNFRSKRDLRYYIGSAKVENGRLAMLDGRDRVAS